MYLNIDFDGKSPDEIDEIQNMSLEEAKKIVSPEEIIEKYLRGELTLRGAYQRTDFAELELLDCLNADEELVTWAEVKKAIAAFKRATAVFKILEQYYKDHGIVDPEPERASQPLKL